MGDGSWVMGRPFVATPVRDQVRDLPPAAAPVRQLTARAPESGPTHQTPFAARLARGMLRPTLEVT